MLAYAQLIYIMSAKMKVSKLEVIYSLTLIVLIFALGGGIAKDNTFIAMKSHKIQTASL